MIDLDELEKLHRRSGVRGELTEVSGEYVHDAAGRFIGREIELPDVLCWSAMNQALPQLIADARELQALRARVEELAAHLEKYPVGYVSRPSLASGLRHMLEGADFGS